MIELTRLGGETLVVNVDLILTIERSADTLIELVTGEKLLVRETPGEVIEKAVEFHGRRSDAARVSEVLRRMAGSDGA